jgi:hypothetical protein
MKWTAKIRDENISQLEEKINGLNRKADKLGCAHMFLEIGDVERDECDYPYIKLYRKVTIYGETPKLNGWRLLATLQHDNNLEANIVRNVPGETMSPEYRNRKGVCDHCGHNRYRKDTFVVQHDDGTTKQVGRQCVADFLGHSPEKFLHVANWVDILGKLEEMGSIVNDTLENYSLDAFLAITKATIRDNGWVGVSQAGLGPVYTTVDRVVDIISNPTKMKNYNIANDDLKYAQKVIDWAANLGPKNDYEHNINTIAKQKYVVKRTQKIAASMVESYRRNVEAKNINVESNYIGDVNEVVNLTLTFIRKHEFNSYWGMVYIYKFQDSNGNMVIWKTSNPIDLKEDVKYNVSGKIKEHKEYNKIRQTVLTRCKVNEI